MIDNLNEKVEVSAWNPRHAMTVVRQIPSNIDRQEGSSRATSGARNSRNTGDHLACSGPLEEWPRSLSSSK
jgi:hypothetical protein